MSNQNQNENEKKGPRTVRSGPGPIYPSRPQKSAVPSLPSVRGAQTIPLEDRRLIGLEMGWLACPPLIEGDRAMGSLGDFARAWSWARSGWVDGANVPPRWLRFLRVARREARRLRQAGIGLSGQRAAIEVWAFCVSSSRVEDKL